MSRPPRLKCIPNVIQKIASIALLLILGASFGGCRWGSSTEPPHTLHLAINEKIKGLDPIYAEDAYSGSESAQAYETLFEFHYLKRPYQLTPLLAERMPEVSSDGLVYRIQLKKGVLFQDDPCFNSTGGRGREVTAEDWVYSLKRLADPRLASTGWWILNEKVEGLNAWRELSAKESVTDYAREIQGLKALDRYTLQIKLTQRSSQFLYLLSMPYAAVVPKEAVEFYGKDFLNHAVGTGPFRLKEYHPSSKIVWVRNPTYRKAYYPNEGAPGDREERLLEDAGKPIPFADQIVIQVFVEQQPMWLNFLSGKLDLSGIPKDDFSTVIQKGQELSPDLKAKGISLVKAPRLDITHLSFNMADSLLGKNKRLRQALSLAFDSNTFNEIFYNGAAMAAQGPIPPGIDGYDPQLRNPYRQFDVKKARELLARAGYPEGKGLPALDYATLEGSVSRQQSDFTTRLFGAIGVKLNVNVYSWPQFLESVKNKKAQIWSMAWSADYPDAENFFQLFYGANVSPGPNDSNYSNPEFDQLYEESLVSTDPERKKELNQKMVKILIEDCPWIFEAHRLQYVLVQKWLKNYKPHDFGHSNYKYYRVDPTLKR